MLTDKCKKCRRAGEKLFLKGERCFTAKCAITRKPYLPGPATKSGKSRRPSTSEYGAKLREKQKTKFSYGLRTKQFDNYVKEAAAKAKGGDVKSSLFGFLESRLDNVVYRLGLAESRSVARQIVTHGHITVNGRRVNVPSRRMFVGDKIAIRRQSASKGKFKDLEIKMKKYTPPNWIRLDKEKKEGEVVGAPSAENI